MSDSDSSDSLDERELNDDGDSGPGVELGFVAPIKPSDRPLLHLRADWGAWDGGKVGGAPVWLLPSAPLPSLCCGDCGAPLSLLLQVYCPLDEAPDAFHRSLYVFLCKARGCAARGRSARVLRAQLPRANALYAPDSGAARFSDDQAAARAVGCALCGQHAPLSCARCHVARYCGKDHQREHWVAGGHKRACARCAASGTLVEDEDARRALEELGSASLFPELALEIDAEPDASQAVDEYEAQLLADFEQRKQQQEQSGEESDLFSDASDIDVTQRELNEAIGALPGGQDKQYVRFLTRVALAKDQVLRYARWRDERALWVHERGTREPGTAPACPRCGGARKFELQVLPQLLFYLKVDADSSLSEIGARGCDWGTLAVYTCAQSCPLDAQYADEFLHYQPPYAGN